MLVHTPDGFSEQFYRSSRTALASDTLAIRQVKTDPTCPPVGASFRHSAHERGATTHPSAEMVAFQLHVDVSSIGLQQSLKQRNGLGKSAEWFVALAASVDTEELSAARPMALFHLLFVCGSMDDGNIEMTNRGINVLQNDITNELIQTPSQKIETDRL
jgi:hypothetical protein